MRIILREFIQMRKICFCCLLFFLAGCGLLPVNVTGDVPSSDRVQIIKPNKHSKADVLRLSGSPAHTTLFEEESWVWVETKEQMRAFLPPKEFERQVLVISFKPDETVKRVMHLSLSDALEVTYDTEETPSYGKDLNVFQEMLGNFGRFAATKEER